MQKQKLITNNRLKIYYKYSGDSDGFARVGLVEEKVAFVLPQGNIWSAIESAIQDIELIGNGLASAEYAARCLQNLRELCDDASYSILTEKLL